jgi:GNAT superfamily N-acetyltransferase
MNHYNLIREFKKENYLLSTDRSKLNVPFIHAFLTRSYWAEGISQDKVQTAIDNTLCFGLYENEKQVGFCNVITDFSRFAYLCNVFIIEEQRGKGLSKWMLQNVFEMPELQLRRWMLGTLDMHALYKKYGFHALTEPWRWMEKRG